MAWASSDTFSGRTVTSNTTGNWSTASDGESWSCVQGTGGTNTFSVGSGEGTLSESSGTGVILMKLGSNSGTDMEMSCRMSPGNASDSVHVFARMSDNTHFYRLDMQVGGTSLVIGGKNGGSFFTIATSSNVGFTMTIGTFYWMRFRVIGTSLYGKVWIDGNTEPQAWNVTATDSTIASGGIGCGANPQGSANCRFDTFNAFSLDASISDSVSFSDSFSDTSAVNETDIMSYPSYSSTVQGDSPLVYYRLDEGAGTTAYDFSGNGSNGTLSGGVTLAQSGALSGVTDTAMLFNGSTGHITIPQTSLPIGAQPWSIEAWCKTPSLPGNGVNYSLIGFGSYVSHEMAELLINGNGTGARFSLTGYGADIFGSYNVAVNTWYHVVGTYDGTTTRLYVNGALIASGAFTLNVTVAFASVGSGNVSGQDWFNGTLDEPAIYNYTLTSTQVLNHYLAGTARQIEQLSVAPSSTFTDSNSAVDGLSPTSVVTVADNLDGYRATVLGDSPIAYYRLDESSGTTAFDSTPNARNGTITSGVTLSQTGGIAGDTDTAMSFARASSGHVTLPQSGLPTGSSQWSVEGWCYPTTTTGGYYMLGGFGTYSNHNMAVIGINGSTVLTTYSGDITGPTVKVNTWNHVVGTFDGTNINLYTNGTLSAHTAEVPNIVLSFANIGAGSGTDYFNGIIDEFAIYNYALTQAQVTAHYQAGTAFTNETLQMIGVPSLVDTGSLLDTVSATEKTTLSDSGSLVDTSSNAPAFSGADSLATGLGQLTETIIATQTDSSAFSSSHTLSGALSLTDSGSLQDTAANADAYSATDAMSTGPGQFSGNVTASLVDLSALTDALSLALTESATDTAALQDKLANISVSTLKDALSLLDSYAATELLSLIDQASFSDKLFIIPEDIQLIIKMITTCRNGLATTSSRNGTTTTSSRNGAFIPLSFSS